MKTPKRSEVRLKVTFRGAPADLLPDPLHFSPRGLSLCWHWFDFFFKHRMPQNGWCWRQNP